AASGAYEQHVADEASRVEQQWAQELDSYWRAYRENLVGLFDARTSAEELANLEAEVRGDILRDRPDTPARAGNVLLRCRLHDIKCERMHALSKEEFRAHRSLRALRHALIERHDIDLLPPSSEGQEGEGKSALPATS